MRFSFSFFILLLHTISGHGQTSLIEIDLKYGKYDVGFHHYLAIDSTRTYSRIFDYTNKTIARPIPVSIWYPSSEDIQAKNPLRILDYFEILKEEEEWEFLPNEQVLNWFYYANSPDNRNHLKEKANAYAKLGPAEGKFPIVIYAPSFQASSIENFALCEYLASHGYIVISSPSRGTETRWFSNNYAKEIETQARDVEFLIREIGNFPIANSRKISVMGFSFGGLSNVIAQNRNKNIRAVVSLDGTERYQYALLKESQFFDVEKLNVPYLHMAQKDIPDIVLREDNIDAELNTKFELFDSLSQSPAYRLKFNNLTHSHFSSLGVIFSDRDQRQDKSDAEIMESYNWVATYVLSFLDAYLKDNPSALELIDEKPSDHGVRTGIITKRIKQPESREFTFQDFNDLVSNRGYQNLSEIYQSIKKKYPSFKIAEGNLNTLGLQLVFNPKTSRQGIAVFLLAIELYPDSANLYDSLAEGYLFIGDKEKANESFERSLELNPQNQNAIDRLAQLKK